MINKKLKILIGVMGAIIIGVLIGFLVVRAFPDFFSESFNDESMLYKGTEKIDLNSGQVTIAPCYTPNPYWTEIATTVVRDISVIDNANATTVKKIYCDDYNCILVNPDYLPPIPICIATDPNVYGNILWARTDSTSSQWGPPNLLIPKDIGGTHPSNLRAGDGNTLIGEKNWLERYYWSASGTYPAMDVCKAKGPGWRLPTILELDSIRDMSAPGAKTRLPGIATTYYWSSTEYSASSAYSLNFSNGWVYSNSKANLHNVRCVRGW